MKKIVSILILFFVSFSLVAQQPIPLPRSLRSIAKSTPKNTRDTSDRKVRFVVGGNIGFQVSNNILDMQLSPHFGVMPVVDWLCVGIGGTYQLTYYKDIYGVKSFQHIFGGNVFIEGYVWQRLVLHAEYELMSFPESYVFTTDPLFVGVNGRPTSHGILMGPGYKQDINSNLSVYSLFLFSVYDPQNIRGIMDIRVGVNYKF